MKIPNSKLSEGQQVIVLKMLVDGESKDIGGYVEGRGRGVSVRNKIQVKVNGVSLYFPEERLMDYEEYWRIKNSK